MFWLSLLSNPSFESATPSAPVQLATVHPAALLQVQHFLEPHGEVSSRQKSWQSIWAKMTRKGIGLESIADRLAARVLLPTEDDCYALLDTLHDRWQHDPTELDDYITHPKPNGYRSLHTVVNVPIDGTVQPVEVQLRTHAMHAEAENGNAAHWRYKQAMAVVASQRFKSPVVIAT